MINRSPWLWGARKTAAGMTGRTSNGIQILQGRRAKGQSNPSEAYIGSQVAASLLWPIFRSASGFIKMLWYNVPSGQYASNAFFKRNYDNALDFTDPMNPVVIPANLIFASGVMTPTVPTSAVADVSVGNVVVDFPDTPSDASQSANDGSWMVIVNRTKNITVSGSGGIRSDGSAVLSVIPELQAVVGNTIDIYLSFNNNGTIDPATSGSETRYITTTVVA